MTESSPRYSKCAGVDVAMDGKIAESGRSSNSNIVSKGSDPTPCVRSCAKYGSGARRMQHLQCINRKFKTKNGDTVPYKAIFWGKSPYIGLIYPYIG